MFGTPPARETIADFRPAPASVGRPPVLIEVPALPGAAPGPHRVRASARPRSAAPRPRRRLRREVRWVGASIVLGVAVASAAMGLRALGPALAGVVGAPAEAPDPFSIELQFPIPEPTDPDGTAARIELLPLAFPGYLLPGEGDGDGPGEE